MFRVVQSVLEYVWESLRERVLHLTGYGSTRFLSVAHIVILPSGRVASCNSDGNAVQCLGRFGGDWVDLFVASMLRDT